MQVRIKNLLVARQSYHGKRRMLQIGFIERNDVFIYINKNQQIERKIFR